MSGQRKFKAMLVRPEGVGTWTYLTAPFDVAKVYGRKGQIKVKGTIDDVPFRSSLMPRGDGSHYLVVNKSIRDRIGASAGHSVQVVLEPDAVSRTVRLPRDFKKALAAHPVAERAFAKLANSHK